jgi:phytoene/squalene synthetase
LYENIRISYQWKEDNKRMKPSLAASITKNGSHQTYYTFRLLADPDRVEDACRAYAYFRWLDDCFDKGVQTKDECGRLLKRQKSILKACYRQEAIRGASPEEGLLVDLVRKDPDPNSGLHAYLHNMMAVLAFDAGRRGRMITQRELDQYTQWLACSVTEVMHYMIGHDSPSPQDDTRYLAVSAAHITHMLRDTVEDVQAGYFNIPAEVLEKGHITPADIHSEPYCAWVRGRVALARTYFGIGRNYMQRVASTRCRLAGFAYMARFEWLLDTIEKEGYHLRPAYDERKSLGKGWQMGWRALTDLLGLNKQGGPVSLNTVPSHEERL